MQLIDGDEIYNKLKEKFAGPDEINELRQKDMGEYYKNINEIN